MTPGEFEILKNVYAALRCIAELAYYTNKRNQENELKYAIKNIEDLIEQNAIIDSVNLKHIARKKVEAGTSLKEWHNQCRGAIVTAAREFAGSVGGAGKLLKCSRETIFYAKRKAKDVKV